jgi:hypothetical protein
MVRQEIVTDLLGLITDVREPAIRIRLLKLVRGHLRSGLASTQRAEQLWPALEEVKKRLQEDNSMKPAAAKRHLQLFEQLDRVQSRSLDLLHGSFDNIQLILERLQPADPAT